MELFKSGLKSVLGAQQPGAQPTGAETVERLLDRVHSSTLLDDRRDACRAIKAMSRKYRVEVGAQGMDTMVRVLEADRSDTETVGYALDTLCNVVSPEAFEEEVEDGEAIPEHLANLGEQFTEIFIKKNENVIAVLGLLEEFDFHVRWPAVRLLTNLLTNRQREIQEIVLVSPMGVAKLVDLLSDSREVIRNDALLLLIQLTKSNPNIQKIVAFENAFDKLFDVISEEGYSDGGIVVEDCLNLMLNLLKNNSSNQTFFKEGSFIHRLTPLFALPAEGNEMGWSAQKVSNIHYMLMVVRTLVSPSNPALAITACQKAMKSCGLLESLCTVLMANGVPADILTETVNAVAEVIRGCQGNQEHFASVVAPSNPPRPAIVVLLMSMVNDKQPFVLRCAVLYCFQCFLYKNELGQAQIVQTLLPATAEAASITAGQLLCGGLFSPDSLSTWLASVALSYTLVENPLQKEQLLRVQLATGVGSAPVSLLHQCTTILQQSGSLQTQMGILILLCAWLAHCPVAVSHFLNVPSSIPYLTSQVGATDHDENQELVQAVCAFLMGICINFNDNSVPAFTKDGLRQLIAKRIGIETFLDKLGEVSKHELYSKVAKHPQLNIRQANSLLFDHEFCRLFKALEGMVVKGITPKPSDEILNGESAEDESQPVLAQYKDLIREQDQYLKELRETLENLRSEHSNAKSEMEEMRSTIQELRDQNALLRAQQRSNGEISNSVPSNEVEVQQLRQQLQESQQKLEKAEENISQKDMSIKILEERVLQEEEASSQGELLASYKQQLDDLQRRLTEREAEVQRLQAASSNQDEIDSLKRQLQETERARDQAESRAQEASKMRDEAVASSQDAEEKLQNLRKDQEDLLELLTDQDTKLNEYKKNLQDLGQKIEDEDEDEDADGLLNEVEDQ